MRDNFFDPTSKVNRGGGNQAEHSGLRFLTALIGGLVYLGVQIQHDHNPLTFQAGTIYDLPQGVGIIAWQLHLLSLTEK